LAPAFPQFDLLELLGQGGMGIVYKARQRSLDRLVAIKVIPADLSDTPNFLERFHREARTLARLNHPHIVAAYDFGQAERRCYFVMEYVAGSNLRQVLRRGPLEPESALAVALQVCDALAYAHQLGVVHRDIKPENILLSEPDLRGEATAARLGRVKIADFGLARLLDPTDLDFTLTGPEHLLGTPAYMAPEQFERPHQTDQRVDLYALGVTLYEMLTGELPLGRFPAVSERVDVDPRLNELVLRCLAKEPGQRPGHAAEVRQSMLAIARSSGGRGPGLRLLEPTRRRWRGWLPCILAAVLLLAIVGVVASQLGRRAPSKPNKEMPMADVPPARPMIPMMPTVYRTSPRTFSASPAASASRAPDAVPSHDIELSNPELTADFPDYTLRIDYKFPRGSASPGTRYFWIVESARGWAGEQSLFWHELAGEGRLRTRFHPFGPNQGSWETWLEAEESGPFRPRHRVSNVVQIRKD
jgi:serine/threonine protein kinase